MSSYRELYEYLLSLATILKERKMDELSEAVRFASAHAASNISTEFLGESRIALRRVSNEENGILTNEERADLLEVVNQIDEAFKQKQ